MKHWKKISAAVAGLVVVTYLSPIVWFAFGKEAYYLAPRCWCGNRSYYRMDTSAPEAARLQRVWNVWAVWIDKVSPDHGGKAQRISCVNNLKQIGLAFLIWAGDNNAQFPFNVSTNAGGTMEFCNVGKDGFDLNALFHFQVMSNELNSPKILVCPQDKNRKAALRFDPLQTSNVTYRVHSGTNISDANPRTVLAVCPIDGNVLYCDGTVVGE